jgi:hypothetical protein
MALERSHDFTFTTSRDGAPNSLIKRSTTTDFMLKWTPKADADLRSYPRYAGKATRPTDLARSVRVLIQKRKAIQAVGLAGV